MLHTFKLKRGNWDASRNLNFSLISVSQAFVLTITHVSDPLMSFEFHLLL